MKIGVVYVDSGWILQTIATKMCEADDRFVPIPMSEVRKGKLPCCDAYYYVDVQNCWNRDIRMHLPWSKHVGMFTHLDKDSPESFRPGWEQLDGVVHMCQRYRNFFMGKYAGMKKQYRANQMTVIVPGEVSHLGNARVQFGVVQRGEHIGKGAEFLPKVIEALPEEVKDGMMFDFCGKGWMENGLGGDYHGVAALNYSEDQWEKVIETVDYLLIPSLYEGGPMSLLEALATCTGIVAAEVGFVVDFWEKAEQSMDFYMFHPGDVPACTEIIDRIVTDRIKLRKAVEDLSYASYAAQVHDFIEGLPP